MSASILVVGILFFVAHAFALLFEKKAIPDVLLLMVIGILVGPALHLTSPADFGKWGGIMSSIALVLILFEGGMTLEIGSIRSTLRRALPLFLVTFLGSIAISVVVGVFVMALPILSAVTFGCILASISPAVVLPIAKGLGLSRETSDVLVIESSLTDVFSVILVFTLISDKGAGGIAFGRMLGSMLSALVFAAFIGLVGSFVWLRLLNFVRRFPNTMLSTFAFLFIIYGFSQFLGFSGAIAALAFGLGLANKPFGIVKRMGIKMKLPDAKISESEMTLFGEIIFIIRTFFFLYLGISIRFSGLATIGFALAITVGIYILRIAFTLVKPAVGAKRRDLEFISIMAPKGLATAVLAGLPIAAGMAGADLMREYAYDVVLFSILLTAALAFLIKRGILVGVLDRLFAKIPASAPAGPE
jgi:NhaP-type Na+/H+ or K+/H+ antiporter